MADVQWVKIAIRIWDDKKIKIIDTMPESDAVLLIWIKLITLAGETNDGGYIYLSNNIPYTEETLATIFNRPLNTVRLALATFKRFNMIEVNDRGILLLNWQKHQNVAGLDKIREQTRERVKKHRQLLLSPASCNVTRNVTVTLGNAIEEEEDKDKEEDKEDSNSSSQKCNVTENNDLTDVVRVYEQNIGQLTPILLDELEILISECPVGWFADAVKEAVRNNVRKLAYVKGILEHWKAEGRGNGHGHKPQTGGNNGQRTNSYRDNTKQPTDEEYERSLE